jgi:hypothetical protein
VTVRLASSGMEEEYTLAQVGQAADVVQTIAHSRNQEGITPAARHDYDADDTRSDDKEALRSLLDEDEDDEAATPPAKRGRGPSQRKAPSNTDSAPGEQHPTRKRSRRKRKPAASKEASAQASTPTEQPSPHKPEQQAAAETPAQELTERKKPRRRRKRKKPPQQAEE